MSAPFRNEDLPSSIAVAAISMKIGAPRCVEVGMAVLDALRAAGWRFTRPDDPAYVARLQAGRAFADVFIGELGIDPDEHTVTITHEGREHRISLARWMAAVDVYLAGDLDRERG